MVASLQQSTVNPSSGLAQVSKQTFTLDGSDRLSTIKGYTDTVQLKESLNHYDSDSDSPAWIQTKTRPDSSTAWTTTWNRYIGDLADALAIDVNDSGTATLQLGNLHGDIVATATIGQSGIGTYGETDEYGNASGASRASSRYGWLGAHQRDSETVGGATLMGTRLYTPVVGHFLSIDSVLGGNDNRYTYPVDPINKQDLDGKSWWSRELCSSMYFWLACKALKYGTFSATLNSPVLNVSVALNGHGRTLRGYGSFGFSLNWQRIAQKWRWSKIGASVGWSPGRPNPKSKVSGGGFYCLRGCIGAQSGFKGRGTYRGWSPYVGFGVGAGAWTSVGGRIFKWRIR